MYNFTVLAALVLIVGVGIYRVVALTFRYGYDVATRNSWKYIGLVTLSTSIFISNIAGLGVQNVPFLLLGEYLVFLVIVNCSLILVTSCLYYKLRWRVSASFHSFESTSRGTGSDPVVGLSYNHPTTFQANPIASRTIVDALSEAYVLLDALDNFLECNKKALEWFAPMNDLKIGDPIAPILSRIDGFGPLAKGGFSSSGEWTITIKRRNERGVQSFRIRNSPIVGSHLQGALIMILDISDMVEMTRTLQIANEKLQDMNTVKDQVLGMLAHDLRSPLIAMRNLYNISNASSFVQSTSADARFLVELEYLNNKAALLVGNVFAYTSLKEYVAGYPCGPLSSDSVLATARKAILPSEIYHSATVEYDHCEDVLVVANQELLTLVLWNLVELIIELNPFGAKIAIRTDIDGQFLKISISGTGAISPGGKIQKTKFYGITDGTLPNEKSMVRTRVGLYVTKCFLTYMHSSLSVVDSRERMDVLSFVLPRYFRSQLTRRP